MAHGPKFVLFALVLVLAIPSGASGADLPGQRFVCQQEARQHIRGPRQVDLDLYRRSVERRQIYVRDCMSSGPRDVEETGSVSVPLPPKRPSV